MLHPLDQPFCLLQRRGHDFKPADGSDGRGESVDKVPPGLEEEGVAAACLFSSSSSLSSSVASFLSGKLVLRLERRQEKAVRSALAVIGCPYRLLQHLGHPSVVEGPQKARVVQPPFLRKSLGVPSELEVSEGVVCFVLFRFCC